MGLGENSYFCNEYILNKEIAIYENRKFDAFEFQVL